MLVLSLFKMANEKMVIVFTIALFHLLFKFDQKRKAKTDIKMFNACLIDACLNGTHVPII